MPKYTRNVTPHPKQAYGKTLTARALKLEWKIGQFPKAEQKIIYARILKQVEKLESQHKFSTSC